MSDKKNIDRLFQERFKDFESVPNEKIWNNIHDALHEKKKRRIIPLWWKLSGIAAGFILAFFVFNTFTNLLLNAPSVVVAPKEIDNGNPNKANSTPTEDSRVAVENIDSSANSNSNDTNLNTTTTETKTATGSTTYSFNAQDSEIISNQNRAPKSINLNKKILQKNKLKVLEKNAVANNSDKKNNQKLVEERSDLKEKTASNSSSEQSFDKNQLVHNEGNLNKNVPISSENNSLNKNKIVKDIDSTALALATETNPLEEILKKKNEKGEEVLATAKMNRWQVTTNVAPIYFNSASNGSPIESQFEENTKSYENNLSIGLGIQYAVTKKLAVRAGLNNVILGYATNDVIFFGALNSLGVSTLSTSNSTSNIEVISANNTAALRPFEDNLQNTESGVLNQRMGYYEVPLELSYALIDRKFGIHVIGGLSTLFLNENSVSVQSATTTMSLGKANNLNDIHFSSNIGLGFKYEFWKNFEAHFEPTFKYQINTFSRNDGNFKPYFVGLYTGISFKF